MIFRVSGPRFSGTTLFYVKQKCTKGIFKSCCIYEDIPGQDVMSTSCTLPLYGEMQYKKQGCTVDGIFCRLCDVSYNIQQLLYLPKSRVSIGQLMIVTLYTSLGRWCRR